jgi:hypothetical protein
MNTPSSKGRMLAEGMKIRGIKPEWEVFSPTHILQDVTTLLSEGHDDEPHFINLVMNVHRNFQNAMPYSPRYLQMMVDMLPRDSLFCVSGIGPSQLNANINALLLGGHARVGLETTCISATANSQATSNLQTASFVSCATWIWSRRHLRKHGQCCDCRAQGLCGPSFPSSRNEELRRIISRALLRRYFSFAARVRRNNKMAERPFCRQKGGSPMRESRPAGSVRGASGNGALPR